eukprot:352764-Chlamydomonas_euryale.AAC.1
MNGRSAGHGCRQVLPHPALPPGLLSAMRRFTCPEGVLCVPAHPPHGWNCNAHLWCGTMLDVGRATAPLWPLLARRRVNRVAKRGCMWLATTHQQSPLTSLVENKKGVMPDVVTSVTAWENPRRQKVGSMFGQE